MSLPLQGVRERQKEYQVRMQVVLDRLTALNMSQAFELGRLASMQEQLVHLGYVTSVELRENRSSCVSRISTLEEQIKEAEKELASIRWHLVTSAFCCRAGVFRHM